MWFVSRNFDSSKTATRQTLVKPKQDGPNDACVLTKFSSLNMLFEMANLKCASSAISKNIVLYATSAFCLTGNQKNSSKPMHQSKIHLANLVKVSQGSAFCNKAHYLSFNMKGYSSYFWKKLSKWLSIILPHIWTELGNFLKQRYWQEIVNSIIKKGVFTLFR